MDARKFFFVSFGILALVAAYQLGARRAEADWSGLGWVVGIGDGQVVWNAGGEAYTPNGPAWLRQPSYDLPVPAADVRLIDGGPNEAQMLLVTHDDRVFAFGGFWSPMQPVPSGTVAIREQSFGKTKAAHRK